MPRLLAQAGQWNVVTSAGCWVRWRMGKRWTRTHYAEGMAASDVGVGCFPMVCGARAPVTWAGDIVAVDDLDAACLNCLRIREERRSAVGWTTRTSRQTGRPVTVARAADLNLADDGGPWVTLCDDHGTTCHHPDRRTAEGWAADPRMWCEPCQRDERGTMLP